MKNRKQRKSQRYVEKNGVEVGCSTKPLPTYRFLMTRYPWKRVKFVRSDVVRIMDDQTKVHKYYRIPKVVSKVEGQNRWVK